MTEAWVLLAYKPKQGKRLLHVEINRNGWLDATIYGPFNSEKAANDFAALQQQTWVADGTQYHARWVLTPETQAHALAGTST
jgi:hypothetical protein